MNKSSVPKNKTQVKTLYKAWLLMSGFLLGLLSVTAILALADKPQMLDLKQTRPLIAQTVIRQPNTLKDAATLWGLSTSDFKQYLTLMTYTPSGHWYKTLDPAEVLALNAKNRQQMMHYAKLQARHMHARIIRELTFDRLYYKAYKDLYPDETPVLSPHSSVKPSDTLQSGDRLWLFIRVDTVLSRFAYQHLIKMIQTTPNTVLDIYFVGNNASLDNIQQWAITTGIARNQVNQQVTLNQGESRFEAITNGKTVPLPFAGILHHHHFQPITLSSLL